MKQGSIRTGLAGLSLACTLFAMPAAAQEETRVEVLLRDTVTWNGAALPAYPLEPPEITIVRITIPPGERLPVHKHPVINGGVLLAGELTVRTEAGQEVRIQEGDPLLEVVDTWHFGTNTGSVPADIIVFYVGTPGTPITVSKNATR